MKVLLLDNYDSFTYNIVELLRQLHITDFTVRFNDQITISEASDYSHIILSPGPATPSASGMLLPIIQALYSTHALLGICLGHQAIAEALGGNLVQVTIPYHGYQTRVHVLTPSKIFQRIPNTFEVGLYHSWLVDSNTLPPELLVTARSRENNIMAIQHQSLPVYGVQFHPESYMSEYGAQLVQNFLYA